MSEPIPVSIQRIDHFVITATDVDATCEFYARVLGMEVREIAPGRKALYFGPHKINVHPPVGEGPTHRAENPSIGGADFCLITETPLADVVAHLKDEGIELEAGPDARSGAMGEITSVYFRDPDGNLVEVSNY